MPGFEKAVDYNLDEVLIKILPLPYFLASKMDHDFEDILYILNYTSTFGEQMSTADK